MFQTQQFFFRKTVVHTGMAKCVVHAMAWTVLYVEECVHDWGRRSWYGTSVLNTLFHLQDCLHWCM